MAMNSRTERDLDTFFALLQKNDALFSTGQARLILTASVFHKALTKLHEMSNSSKMKCRQQAQVVRNILTRVADLKISHYDLGATSVRVSSLKGIFSVAIFSSLRCLTLYNVPLHLVEDLGKVTSNLKIFSVERSLYRLEDIRICISQGSDRLGSFAVGWQALETLNLSHNFLTHLDDSVEIFANQNLNMLNLSYNELESCGTYLLKIPVIRTFDASYNKLIHVPVFAQTTLRSISKLILSSNRIESLRNIAGLYMLEFLDVRHNLIELHSQLTGLEKLQVLKEILLFGNPLCDIEGHISKTMSKLSPLALKNCPRIDDYQTKSEDYMIVLENVSAESSESGENIPIRFSIVSSGSGRSLPESGFRQKNTALQAIIEDCNPKNQHLSTTNLNIPRRSQSLLTRKNSAGSRKGKRRYDKSAGTSTASLNLLPWDGPPLCSTPKSSRSSSFFQESPDAEINSLGGSFRGNHNRALERYISVKDQSVDLKRFINNLVPPEERQLHRFLNTGSSAGGSADFQKVDEVSENEQEDKETNSKSGKGHKNGKGAKISNGRDAVSPLMDVSIIACSETSKSHKLTNPSTSNANIPQSKELKIEPMEDAVVERRPRTSAYVAPEELGLGSIIARLYDPESEHEAAHKFKLSLYYEELKITDLKTNTFLQDVYLKKIGDVNTKYLPEYCCETATFRDVLVLQLFFPFALDPFLKFSFVEDQTEFVKFTNKLQNQWKLCSSLYRCPKCKNSILCDNETKKCLCPECCVLVLPEIKSDLTEVLASVPSSNTETMKNATDEETSSRESLPIDIQRDGKENKKNSVHKRLSVASSSGSGFNRTSQLFYPNSVQDGSNLSALSNKIDGFTEAITQLEHHLDLFLTNEIFEVDEAFQQLIKGYLSTSDRPQVFPGAVIITNLYIRFFEIKPTEDEHAVESFKWLINIAHFPFNKLVLIESGLSGQSLTLKFQNSATSFVLVTFSRESVSTLVDIIMRLCLNFNWYSYSSASKTKDLDFKMLDKYVLAKITTASSPSLDETKNSLGSIDQNVHNTSANELVSSWGFWICRCANVLQSLILLSRTEKNLFLAAVNFHPLLSANDRMKSRPFVLLDSREIVDVYSIQRFQNRRNVVKITMLNKSVNNSGSSSFIDFTNPETKAIEWNLKLGNMRQVSEFVKGVLEKWEVAYQMKLPVEVLPETPLELSFFDD